MKMRRNITRRTFLATAAALAATRIARANPLGLPIGLQLYSVREQMAQDLPGTFAAVAAAGYTEVEAATLPKKPAAEIRAALDAAGLHCVSTHCSFDDLFSRFDQTVDFQKLLGVRFIVCPSPGRRNPPAASTPPTLDDWHYNAEQFNRFGEKLAAHSIRFAYHNHTGEFAPTEGQTPYLELLRLTDPARVSFEMDCGWVKVAGRNPIELMQAHPNRFCMLHVKDFHLPADPAAHPHDAVVTELGRGSIVYPPILAQAARNQHIQHIFAEQEAFDIPWKESLKVDADYMRRL